LWALHTLSKPPIAVTAYLGQVSGTLSAMATSRSCRTAAAVQLAALGALLLVAQHAAATRICLNMIMKVRRGWQGTTQTNHAMDLL
jgi:hypothetical protein